MSSLRTRFVVERTSRGRAAGLPLITVMMLACAIIMIRPESTPWPATSPMATHRSPASVSMMS